LDGFGKKVSWNPAKQRKIFDFENLKSRGREADK
jgi:hypothetical protein